MTRQVATGNGGLYIPQSHEREREDDRPPRSFVLYELGCSLDSDMDVFTTARRLTAENAARKDKLLRDEREREDEAKRQGIKVKAKATWDAGHDEFNHAPLKPRRMRADDRPRKWIPSRKRKNAADRALQMQEMIDRARQLAG